MKNKVFFPYGVSNFEQLATQNFIFVDKTPYIEQLELEIQKFVSFLRPRRFGKSLWLSILEYYYDINQKHKFEKLFGKYYIGQNPTPLRSSYRILKLDFSGIDTSTKESTKQGFNFSVKLSVQQFIRAYQIFNENIKQTIFDSDDAEELMNAFFRNYQTSNYSEKIYILFDEYDHFTNDILYRNKDEFIDSVSKQGYIRKFYEVIKSATQSGVVDRVFITGVSPVTLDGLTSGFNILKHLSHHPAYESMMGFSEQEVRDLLRLVLENPDREKEVMHEMREWYNGYKFHEESQQTIYNSDMVLYYLDYFKDYQKAPRTLLDVNIAPDYYKLKQMFQVVDIHRNEQVLEEVLQNGYVAAPLVEQFNFERGFTKSDFVNFLAYLGNLTIDKITASGLIKFKIPNKVIQYLYWQYYSDYLEKKAAFHSQINEVQEEVFRMAEYGNYTAFFELVQKLLKALSNRDFNKFNEKYVKMAMIAYLSQSDIFDIKSETELQGGGYPDLLLFKKSNNPYDHHEFIIELKYLKKEQSSDLERVKQEAKDQVLNYYQQEKCLQSRPYLHLLTVVVIKDDVFVEEVEK